MILSHVLSFAKWHVVRLLDDARATLLRMLEMSVDVRHGYVNVLSDGIRLWRTKRSPLSTEHDGAFLNSQLSVTDNTVSFGTETL